MRLPLQPIGANPVPVEGHSGRLTLPRLLSDATITTRPPNADPVFEVLSLRDQYTAPRITLNAGRILVGPVLEGDAGRVRTNAIPGRCSRCPYECRRDDNGHSPRNPKPHCGPRLTALTHRLHSSALSLRCRGASPCGGNRDSPGSCCGAGCRSGRGLRDGNRQMGFEPGGGPRGAQGGQSDHGGSRCGTPGAKKITRAEIRWTPVKRRLGPKRGAKGHGFNRREAERKLREVMEQVARRRQAASAFGRLGSG
jgi:hypothetical protein